MAQLINNALLDALLGAAEVDAVSQVTVELTDVWFNKTADKTTWTDGVLTYSIDIKNNGDPAATPPGETLTDVVFTDTIAPAIATVIEDTIAVNPAAAEISHTYNSTTGVLVIELNDIPAGDVVTITFQVDRVL